MHWNSSLVLGIKNQEETIADFLNSNLGSNQIFILLLNYKFIESTTGKNSKDSLKSYALEFLSFFAAVTLGFITENQREKWSENERGVQYAIRQIEDIDLDCIRLDEVTENYSLKKKDS